MFYSKIWIFFFWAKHQVAKKAMHFLFQTREPYLPNVTAVALRTSRMSQSVVVLNSWRPFWLSVLLIYRYYRDVCSTDVNLLMCFTVQLKLVTFKINLFGISEWEYISKFESIVLLGSRLYLLSLCSDGFLDYKAFCLWGQLGFLESTLKNLVLFIFWDYISTSVLESVILI